MPGFGPPESEAELLRRADALAGEALRVVAARVGMPVPPNLRRHKGWVGALVERALGADAGSRATPDFQRLAIELKTIPVDGRGRPVESTFVCTIPLSEIGDVEWEASWVRCKLARVLWIPVEGDPRIAPGDRRLGTPLLWSPNDEELEALRFDWEELSGLIGRGGLERITGHLGRVLQVRPKARNAAVRRRGRDADGAVIDAPPRGFYLRARFTQSILARHFAIPQR